MFALVRYQLSILGHSQRYLPPVLLFIGVNALLYGNGAGLALPSFAVTSGAVLVAAGWLTITLSGAEDPVQSLVTTCQAGSPRRVMVSIVLAALICGTGLSVLAMGWGLIAHIGTPELTTSGALAGLHAHLMCATAGVAIGLPCSQLLTKNLGITLAASSLMFTLVLLVKWAPPGIHQLLANMGDNLIKPRALIRATVLSLAAIIVSPLATASLWQRRP